MGRYSVHKSFNPPNQPSLNKRTKKDHQHTFIINKAWIKVYDNGDGLSTPPMVTNINNTNSVHVPIQI